MIDFSKPMRVRGGPEMRVVIHDSSYRLVMINHMLCVADENGKVFPLGDSNGMHIENTPPEPRRRYQAQGKFRETTDWLISRDTGALPWKIVAWLIETDHGEGASPRWTYEREEVRK